MDVRFLAPGFVLLAAAALLPWLGPYATRDRRHAALRSAAIVLVALALARPVRERVAEVEQRVLVVDQSASVTDAQLASARRFAAEAVASDAAGEREAEWTLIEVGPRERGTLELEDAPRGLRRVLVAADDASPLSTALASAARLIAPGAGGGVTVLTDGLATEPAGGNALARAVEDLAARRLPLDVALHDDAPAEGEWGDLRPVGVRVDGVARVGLVAELVAELEGTGQRVACRLVARGETGAASGAEADAEPRAGAAAERELARAEGVEVDGLVSVALAFEPDAPGFADLALVVDVEAGVDARPGDLRYEFTLPVQDPLRVLYLGERMTGGGERLAALLGDGFDVEVAQAAVSEADLAGRDLVVLDDRPAASVPASFQAALVSRVTDRGLGLVAAGGEAAFGPGGYHEQPLEAVLPVEFVQKEEKRDPSTTLVVIIDTSGSMGGNRVQLAKEVARLAIRRLLPHDKVGMVEFYGAKRWAVPIQPASNSIEIERALNRLDAGGGTVILPAIDEAYYGLKNVRTRFKHVLILTDGGVETGAFEPLLRRMADDGINVSTVLIGPDAHSEFLVNLANWGQGRFYSVPNRFNLPEILLKQPASAKLPAYRPGLVDVRARGGASWLPREGTAASEAAADAVPPLGGYVETRPRPGAERILETAGEGHPILASWRYGLGRVSALTTEPTGPGTSPWRDWSGYGPMLARALSLTAADTAAPFAFALSRDGERAVLVAERRSPANGSAATLELPRAEWIDEAGAGHALAFTAVAPDRFEASRDLAHAAGLCVVAGGPGAGDAVVRLALDPLSGALRERQVHPSARASLARASELTGGAVRPLADLRPGAATASDLADRSGVARLRSYAPHLSLLALLLFLADLYYRRRPAAAFVPAGRGAQRSARGLLGLGALLALALAPDAAAAQQRPALRAQPLRTLAPARSVQGVPAAAAPAVRAPAGQEARPAARAPEAPKVLSPEVIAHVADLIERGFAPAIDAAGGFGRAAAEGGSAFEAAAVYDLCVAEHGDLALLMEHLSGVAADSEGERRRSALRLLGHLEWRYGDLADALARFETLAERADDLEARLSRARLLDALGRTADALAAYTELVAVIEDAALASRLRLRMALMSMETGGEAEKDALATFARAEGRATDLQNRAAIVLALLGRPADAVSLYEVPAFEPEEAGSEGDPSAGASAPEGDDAEEEGYDEAAEKKARKSSAYGELRVAEWAIAAGDFAAAQAAAWRAAHLGPVARERRYALTLLAEAHRADGSLDALLERFSAERGGLPAEARRVWIDLLRETGSYDDAIAMSRGEEAASFTRLERQRLLEMYREAGRTEEMLAAYAECIDAEPSELVWREGLGRHWLEQGDRAAAVATFEEWFAASGGAPREPLVAAESLAKLGLDELAARAAEVAIAAGEHAEAAYLFLFELHRDRGRLEDARAALARLDAHAAPGSPARMQLSDSWERLGDLAGAVRVLEGVRAARPEGEAGEDLEMRLAWLYSEVDREDDALALWKELWTRVKSLARRRFVEDRLMTVAARLGVLADVAVELERKLYAGEAEEKDTGLLVRLYTKVGDAVSAAEIVDEYLRLTGGGEIEALTEKARVYLACNDYFHYEKAVARLIELDPAGRPDYYQQLAMSQLERGKPDEARATLAKLQELPGGDDASAEFEAGVLALSGLREEAIAAYRRGLVAHPERIDSYLLMASLMKQVRESDRAVGMFQHLAETADGDDLFTIAIDGLLNMLVDAPPRPKMVQWARRITLERLAAREDAPYLYQLLADLAEESEDAEGQRVALENSLAPAGPRRASVLRELMELTTRRARGLGTAASDGDRDKKLAFGRRLVGLGEFVPPEVYLELGDAFLEAGDEGAAARTFDLTREFPDGDVYQRQAAERFEKAHFTESALERYQAVLAASPSDVPLLTKVGELREMLGDDPGAHALYRNAYDLLMGRKPLSAAPAKEDDDEQLWYARNVDEFDQYMDRVQKGLLATFPGADSIARFLADQRALLEAEWRSVRATAGDAEPAEAAAADRAKEPAESALAHHPRLAARADVVRRIALSAGPFEAAEALDRWILAEFPSDDAAFDAAVESRVAWGRLESARRLVDESGRSAEERAKWSARLGGAAGGAELQPTGRIPFEQAIARVLPAIAEGDAEELRDLTRFADLAEVPKEALGRMGVLFAAARAIGDQEAALRIARDWARLALADGGQPYQLEQLSDAIFAALDEETGLAFARYLVGRVLEDPEKNSAFVRTLPKLASRFDEPVVDAEQVGTLLDGYGERYAWGLGPVLELLSPADRAGALRRVWSKLEATNRAGFLFDLITESQEDIPEELGGFIVESLPAALKEADEYIRYAISGLLEVEHSHELVIDVVDAVERAMPELPVLPALRAVHAKAAEREGALALGAAAYAKLAGESDDDYYLTQAKSKLLEAHLPEGRDAFVAELDAAAAGAPDPARIARARIELLLAAEDEFGAAAALDELLAETPDDEGLLQLARRLQLQRGARVAAAMTLEKLAEIAKVDGTKKSHLRTLVNEWTALSAPERALRAQEQLNAAGESATPEIPGFPPGFVMSPGMVIVVNGVAYRGEDFAASSRKGLPKTFEEARKAIVDDRLAEAALILRRLWRQFPVGQPAVRYGPSRYRNLALANLAWPREPDEEAAEKEPSRGGYLAYEPVAPPKPPEPPNAYERLAEEPELVAEIERFFRTVEAHELDRLQRLIEGLLAQEVAEEGRAAVTAELLEEVRSGAGDRAAEIRLLALLDDAGEEIDPAAAGVLRDLVRTIPPRDAAQIRRLARVLLRSGREAEALRLYRWCALQSSLGSTFDAEGTDIVTTVSNRELVEEARENLAGEDRIELISMVLDASRPTDNPWQRESYETFVLDTWDEIVGPVEALARARALCDSARDLGTGLRRSTARRAVPLYLHAGEPDAALEALEVGLAKLDPRRVKSPDERWYRQDPTQPGRLSIIDLRRLLPPGGGELPDAKSWFLAFAGALEGWLGEERVDASDAAQALALTAVRLAEVGAQAEASELAQRLAARDDLAPATQLWVIDALRVTGREPDAVALERALLRSGRLHPERVPDVVARALESDGPAAALELAATTAETSRHPRLLEVLIRASEALGDEEAAERWRVADSAARAAEAALEEAKKPKT